jgi:hypothetical protein
VKENQDLNQVKYFKENEGNLECINHRERWRYCFKMVVYFI